PFAVVEMTALAVPGAQHGAVVYRTLQCKIGNPAVALAHDRQEEAFRRFSRRRLLDDVARFIGEATWRHRNGARERHDLLHAELEVAADQRHGGEDKPLRGFGRGQRAQGHLCLFETSDPQDVMRERIMPTLLVARQRWYGRICTHEPLSLRRRMNAALPLSPTQVTAARR